MPVVPKDIAARIRQRVQYATRTATAVSPLASPLPVALRLLVPRLRLLCYPRQPGPSQVLYKICALNGYCIVCNPAQRYDAAVRFGMEIPCMLPDTPKVLNRACDDISKTRVAETFERTFGYSLTVDPLSYRGAMVEKSDANYRHDGRILQAPIAPEAVRSGMVYQRLVETAEGGEAVDLRTPIYAGRVPLVLVKRRPLASRFSNTNSSVEVREPTEVFSEGELESLARFAAAMGLDFGELDVLRDSSDGRIYIVDVANMPAGPPNGLPAAPARAAIARLAREFTALVES